MLIKRWLNNGGGEDWHHIWTYGIASVAIVLERSPTPTASVDGWMGPGQPTNFFVRSIDLYY